MNVHTLTTHWIDIEYTLNVDQGWPKLIKVDQGKHMTKHFEKIESSSLLALFLVKIVPNSRPNEPKKHLQWFWFQIELNGHEKIWW